MDRGRRLYRRCHLSKMISMIIIIVRFKSSININRIGMISVYCCSRKKVNIHHKNIKKNNNIKMEIKIKNTININNNNNACQ